MTHRRDPADYLPGCELDQVLGRATDGAAQLLAEPLRVDSVTTGGHDEDWITVESKHQRIRDGPGLDAERRSGESGSRCSIVEPSNLTGSTTGAKLRLYVGDGGV
jgi:hypothetical protein